MAQPHIISALIAKRAELAGLITDCQRRQEHARADLAYLDATLRMFDPDGKPQPASHQGDTTRQAALAPLR